MKSNQHEPAHNDGGTDQIDKTKYKNFENRRLSQTTDSSNEDNNSTVGNFVNPIYRDKSIKNNRGSLNKQNSESYDNLNFNNKHTDSQHSLNGRTNTTKPPQPNNNAQGKEEYEMGVHNHGYGDMDRPRPNSWDKSLTAYSPYAIDTPIGGPATESRGNSLSLITPSDNKRDSISKNSDYSFIGNRGDENPYTTPAVNSDYDVIPGLKKGQLPPPRQGTKKSNLAYESAVIQQKTTKHTKKTSQPQSHPKEGSEAGEGSSCCQLIFTVLVGLIALVALIIVFLMVFGIVSAKKCKECEVFEASTGKQTGGSVNTDATILTEFQYLRNNFTALQDKIANTPKPVNQTGTIVSLQREIAQQAQLIELLNSQLSQQQIVTSNLNKTTRDLKSKLTATEKQMTGLDTANQMRQSSLLKKMQNLEHATVRNISRTLSYIDKVNTSLTEDILQTRLLTSQKLSGKISTGNFSKLINDSQFVVDQLYGMINSSKIQMKTLNQTFVDNLETLQFNVTALGKRPDIRQCIRKKKESQAAFSSRPNEDEITVSALVLPGTMIIGASCGSSANRVTLANDEFKCICKGFSNADKKLYCVMHYWQCPV